MNLTARETSSEDSYIEIDTVDHPILVGSVVNDTIIAPEPYTFLIGDNGQDKVVGNAADNIIVGGGILSDYWGVGGLISEYNGGNIVYVVRPLPSDTAELLIGNGGDDVIIGGSWYDRDKDNSISEDELVLHGNTISSDPLVDPIAYSAEELLLSPGFNNIIWAGTGNDTVYGANGFDTIGGGSGNDQLYGFGGVDVIYGGAGNDTIQGGEGDPEFFHRLMEGQSFTLVETLYGGSGNDHVFGEGGVDHIFGGAGRDYLYGGAGDDQLRGGDGDDVLDGGEGTDTLTGGAGADRFDYSDGDGTMYVTDFDVDEDMLLFRDIFEQSEVDSLLDSATADTLDGISGVWIATSDKGGIFLGGVTLDDLGSVMAFSDAVITGA